MFDAFLHNPIFQSGINPGILTLVMLFLLGKKWSAAASASFLLVIAVTYALLAGWSFSVISSAQKIALSLVLLSVVAVAVDHFRWAATDKPQRRRLSLGVFFFLTQLAGGWLLWPVLAREGWQEILFLITLYVTYSLVVLVPATAKPAADERLSALLILSVTSAVVCILGATALYGQLLLAVAVTVGVTVLFRLWWRQRLGMHEAAFMLVGAVNCIIVVAAHVYADLMWYTVIPLAAIMLLPYIRLWPAKTPLLRMIRIGLLALLPVLLAIVMNYSAEEESLY